MSQNAGDLEQLLRGVEESPFNLRTQLRILRKRLWLILGLAVLAGAGAFVEVSRQPKIYRATGTLIIEPSTPQVLQTVSEVVELGASYWSNQFYQTQYKVLQSRDVMQRAVERTGLDRDADFLGLEGIADPSARARAMLAADAVGALQRRVRVEPVKDSQLVTVSVDDTDPKRAQLATDAVMDAYVDRNLDRRLEGSRSASEWLGGQLEDLQGKLEKSELDLYEFKRVQDILSTSMEEKQNIISSRLVALNERLSKVIIERAELESAIEAAEQLKKAHASDPLWALQLPTAAENIVLNGLRASYVKQRSELDAITSRYGEKHPDRVAAEQELASLSTQLTAESARILEALRTAHREALTVETRVTRLVEDVKNEAFELNKKEIDFRKLQREQSNNQRLYELVLGRLKELDLTSLMKSNNARVLEYAQPPGAPILPRPARTLSMAIALALAIGVALAYLLEYLDNTLKGEEDVEKTLGLPFLGLVPNIEAEESGAMARLRRKNEHTPERDLWVFRNPKSAAAECCRAIRTNLLFMSPDKELRTIVVTSSSPLEGKTTTATNIAITMALNGQRVLIVDTDMRRPRLHRAFGVTNEVGLSTTIVGETSVADAIKTTDVPGLSVLPCGPVPPNPSELLHAERFKTILGELRERFDRIVFDTPPVLPVADAAVLSATADGVVMVGRFAQTTRDSASRAVRNLRDVNAPLLGVVMNDVNLRSRAYTYYYGNSYGYYYGHPKKEGAGAG